MRECVCFVSDTMLEAGKRKEQSLALLFKVLPACQKRSPGPFSGDKSTCQEGLGFYLVLLRLGKQGP